MLQIIYLHFDTVVSDTIGFMAFLVISSTGRAGGFANAAGETSSPEGL